jgi:hypothetical protein
MTTRCCCQPASKTTCRVNMWKDLYGTMGNSVLLWHVMHGAGHSISKFSPTNARDHSLTTFARPGRGHLYIPRQPRNTETQKSRPGHWWQHARSTIALHWINYKAGLSGQAIKSHLERWNLLLHAPGHRVRKLGRGGDTPGE